MQKELFSSSGEMNNLRSPQNTKNGKVPISPSLLEVLEKNEGLGAIDTVSVDFEDGNKIHGEHKEFFSEPRALDICCGRGKGPRHHPGNIIFQQVIRKNLDRYNQAESKNSKSAIVSRLVDSLHVDHNLRFVKKDPVVGKWFELPFSIAHEKTGHAIRDQLSATMRQQQLPLAATMMEQQLPLQGKSLLSSPTRISCSSFLSSGNPNRDTKKYVKRRVPPKVKCQLQKKKIKKTACPPPQLLVAKRGPEVLGPDQEEEHHRPWSDHFFGRNIAVRPSSSFGEDTVVHLDFELFDNLSATDRKDLHVRFPPPQDTLPKAPSAPCQSRPYEAVSVGGMTGILPSPNSPLVKIFTINRNNPPCQCYPENNRESCVQRSPLQTAQLEPTPLCIFPLHEQNTETSCHTKNHIWAFPM